MQYQYLISLTANNKVSLDRLKTEINQSDVTIKLKSATHDGTTITLDFADVLPGTQKIDYVDPVISAHTGEPLEAVVKIENTTSVGGPRMSNRGVSFTCTAAINSVDYTIVEPLHIKSGILVVDHFDYGDTFDIQLFHPLDLVNPIWSYTLGEPVTGNVTEIKNDAITKTALQGLVVRFTYHRTGTTDILCTIGMRSMQVI